MPFMVAEAHLLLPPSSARERVPCSIMSWNMPIRHAPWNGTDEWDLSGEPTRSMQEKMKSF
jgi:hypothetical protein